MSHLAAFVPYNVVLRGGIQGNWKSNCRAFAGCLKFEIWIFVVSTGLTCNISHFAGPMCINEAEHISSLATNSVGLRKAQCGDEKERACHWHGASTPSREEIFCAALSQHKALLLGSCYCSVHGVLRSAHIRELSIQRIRMTVEC